MKKVIEGTLCNTDTAKRLGSYDNGELPGDINYVKESLYRTKSGSYFLHSEGGARTQCAIKDVSGHWRSGELITLINPVSAKKWAEEHLDADGYTQAFGYPEERTTISISASTKAKLDEIKARTGMTIGEIVADAIAKY